MPTLSSSDTRLRTQSFWEVLGFLLNSLLFLLIGLQFPAILDHLHAFSGGAPALDAAPAVALVVVARFAWMYSVAPVPSSSPSAMHWATCTAAGGCRGLVLGLLALLAACVTMSPWGTFRLTGYATSRDPRSGWSRRCA